MRRVMCCAAPRSALVLLVAMVTLTTIALADAVEDAVVEWTDADTFDPAECAAVSFHNTDTIPAHRWFTPDVPLSAAEQRRAASRNENTGGERATSEIDGSQQRRLRKSRRRNRRGSGGGSSSPSSPVGTFNGIAISTMKCVGDHCDEERMPQDVHCGVVAPVPKSTGAVVTTDMLEWECHVVRPPHLAETVQFHSVAPECQSVIDGTPVRLPHPNALVAGHRRLLDKDVTLTADDVLRNASEDGGQGKGRAFTVVPNTFAVSRESAEWRDTAAAAKDETEECEFDLKLRRIRLSELLALRQVVDGVDAETAATHAFAQMQRGSGAVVATSGNAPEQGATAGSDPLVFAEVCRVTFRVRLIYKPALIGGVLAILMTIVVFFVVLVVGTSNKKARDEVARARVVKSLDRAEMDAAARAGRPFEGSRAAVGSASSQRQAPSLQEALAQLRGSSQPSPLSGRPSGLSGQSADQAGVIQRGLEAGLSVDEILLREDILRRRDSAEVPRGMSASQFARERQATRLSGRGVAPLHAVVDGLPTTMNATGPAGKSSKTLSPAGKSYNAARNGGWGPNIDGAVD